MKKVSDGWHKVYNFWLYVKDGAVWRGVILRGVNHEEPVGVYRRYGTGWTNIGGQITLDAFYAGWRRGTIRIF